MIRGMIVLGIFLLFAIPVSAQNTAADESCRAPEFIQDNNLSAIYVGESAPSMLSSDLWRHAPLH